MEKRKRIFILGGTGYVGSAVVRNLSVKKNDYTLLMLTRRAQVIKDLEHINTWSGNLVSFRLSLVDDFNPDTIIHMARMGGSDVAGRLIAALRGKRANKRLLNHLQNMPHKPHIIYVSGTLAYGDCGRGQVSEDTPVSPVSFARQYIIAEKPWMKALEEGTYPVSILRPPWIIGNSSWFKVFYINYMRKNGKIPLFGEGYNLMTFLDVDDCAGLIAHATEIGQPGLYYNLFTPGSCMPQMEFASRLSETTGLPVIRITKQEMEKTFGRTLLEALTFSGHITTNYPEFISGYRFLYPTVDEMIRKNLPEDLLHKP